VLKEIVLYKEIAGTCLTADLITASICTECFIMCFICKYECCDTLYFHFV